jgi:hypothetical protein
MSPSKQYQDCPEITAVGVEKAAQTGTTEMIKLPRSAKLSACTPVKLELFKSRSCAIFSPGWSALQRASRIK